MSTAPEGPRPDDHIRGDAQTPLVIIHADFTCPYCAIAHERLKSMPVRGVFRHLALKAKSPRAVALAQASEAAALQDVFWPFADSLYGDPAHVDDPHLWERAQALGLDVERFDADRRSDAVIARVQRDTREAVIAGAMSTPTFLTQGRPDADLYHRLVHQNREDE